MQFLSNQCFIAFIVTNNLSLNSAGVGPNCMLSPTRLDNTINSGKYILVLLDYKELEEFRKYMVSGAFGMSMFSVHALFTLWPLTMLN